jgi:hypothetical protein
MLLGCLIKYRKNYLLLWPIANFIWWDETKNLEYYALSRTCHQRSDRGMGDQLGAFRIDTRQFNDPSSEMWGHCGSFLALPSITKIELYFFWHKIYLCSQKRFAVCHWIVITFIFRSLRDTRQILPFGAQVYPGQSAYFKDAYQRSTSKPYGYLSVDMNPATKDVYILCTHILPQEKKNDMYFTQINKNRLIV